jgi:hypothetical protein
MMIAAAAARSVPPGRRTLGEAQGDDCPVFHFEGTPVWGPDKGTTVAEVLRLCLQSLREAGLGELGSQVLSDSDLFSPVPDTHMPSGLDIFGRETLAGTTSIAFNANHAIFVPREGRGGPGIRESMFAP